MENTEKTRPYIRRGTRERANATGNRGRHSWRHTPKAAHRIVRCSAVQRRPLSPAGAVCAGASVGLERGVFSAGAVRCAGVSARAAEDNAAWGRGGAVREGETVPRVRLRAGCVFRGGGGAGVCMCVLRMCDCAMYSCA